MAISRTTAWLPLSLAGITSAALLWLGTINPTLAISIGNFVHVPLFMAALAAGHIGALFASIAGVGTLLLLPFIQGEALNSGLPLVFLVMVGLPGLVLGYFALLSRTDARGHIDWYPLGMILAWLTVGMLAVYTTLTFAALQSGGEWIANLQAEIVTMISQHMPPENALPIEDLQAIVADILPYIPGAVMAFMLLSMVVNAIIAQWLLFKSGNAKRPLPKMSELALPKATAPAVAVLGLLAAFLPAETAWYFWSLNALVLLTVPLLLAGLAVIHASLERKPMGGLWLVVVYAALVFSPLLAFLPLLLLALLGLAEQWLGWREKALAQPT